MIRKSIQWLYANELGFDQIRKHYASFRFYDLGTQLLKRLTPTDAYQLKSNLAYGTHLRQQLDLYLAKKPRANRALIVFVHGGSWRHGDKKDYSFIGDSFTQEGYDVAVINYRLAPEFVFPEYVDDLNLALDYLDQNANTLNISTDNLILIGHSAGAFNVMALLYAPKPYLSSYLAKIKAIVGLAGPYDFDYKDDPVSEHAFDSHVSYTEVMPLYFIRHNQIGHLLITAANDRIVAAKNSTKLNQALLEHQNLSQLIEIKGTGHITLVASLATVFAKYFKTRKVIVQFLEKSLK